jgi:phosphomannomutase
MQSVLDWWQEDNRFLDLLESNTSTVASHDRVDGLRAVMSNGDILHIRPSGNAPELRIYAESHCSENAHSIVKYALAEIAPFLA